MTDVFLLGAGFSRAVSDSMPLLADLPREMTRQGAWNPDLEPLLNKFDGNVELLLAYLATDQPYFRQPQNLRHRALFLEVAERLGIVLAECQDRAIASGGCPPWLSSLVEAWDRRHVSVVTFNYDTLVEKAYQSLGADDQGVVRRASQLYVVPLTSLDARDGLARWSAKARQAGFVLIKLHGSVNWFYSGSETFFGEVIYESSLKPEWQPDGALMDNFRSAGDKIAFVVPPTTVKTNFFANETVRFQWQRAYVDLTSASDVYVVGYSLPETDTLVRNLLRDAIGRGTTIHIVNRLARATNDPREDEATRNELIARYRAACPQADFDDDYVRVEDDVVPQFADAYRRGLM